MNELAHKMFIFVSFTNGDNVSNVSLGILALYIMSNLLPGLMPNADWNWVESMMTLSLLCSFLGLLWYAHRHRLGTRTANPNANQSPARDSKTAMISKILLAILLVTGPAAAPTALVVCFQGWVMFKLGETGHITVSALHIVSSHHSQELFF